MAVEEAAKKWTLSTQRLACDILTIDDFFEDRLGKYA
jgi:hypothetical protein